MMGPIYWKPGSPTALKKCSERVSNSCTDETDGCCAVISCSYCIEWNPDTGDTVYATADFATNSWTATIAGAAWIGYWERNYYTDECEFVVTLDGVEIYRKSCYEGQSCRDSSDSAPATIDSVAGVITWTKYEPRPLEYVQDEDTNCTVHFCDECECSTECLCVTITEPDTTVTEGEICDTAYECDPPLWEGTVGAFELSVSLGRDEYGRCIITATVAGSEQEPVLFPGCADAAATITLGDGTTIALTAKKCGCNEPLASCCGCPSFGGNDGCIVFDSHTSCISNDRFDLNWSSGRGGMPASPTTWGTVLCEMSATINMAASIPGCGGADIDWTFVIFRVTDPDVSVQDVISDCEWAMEVYADGVYVSRYLEYLSECQVNGLDDPLAWIQFPNVDIGGEGIATITSDFTIPNTKCGP